jgi:hypothetical protein
MKSMTKLSREQISTASAALVNAVRHGKTLTGWPNDNGPASIDDAYLIQHLTHETLGRKQAGWKVGWTTRKLQEANGVREPMVGRIPAETVVRSGSTVRELRPGSLKCEAELAFRLARDLPARPRPYSEMELKVPSTLSIPRLRSLGRALLAPTSQDDSELWRTTAPMRGWCSERRSKLGESWIVSIYLRDFTSTIRKSQQVLARMFSAIR